MAHTTLLYYDENLLFLKNAVTQEHGMGCAVACTAYVLECSYQEALKLYDNPEGAWTKGFYCEEIIVALSKAGKSYSYKKIKATTEDEVLKAPGTIVFIDRSPAYPEGHFLARTTQGSWMNSWINFPLITPAKSGFQKELPGNPVYAVFKNPT